MFLALYFRSDLRRHLHLLHLTMVNESLRFSRLSRMEIPPPRMLFKPKYVWLGYIGQSMSQLWQCHGFLQTWHMFKIAWNRPRRLYLAGPTSALQKGDTYRVSHILWTTFVVDLNMRSSRHMPRKYWEPYWCSWDVQIDVAIHFKYRNTL